MTPELTSISAYAGVNRGTDTVHHHALAQRTLPISVSLKD